MVFVNKRRSLPPLAHASAVAQKEPRPRRNRRRLPRLEPLHGESNRLQLCCTEPSLCTKRCTGKALRPSKLVRDARQGHGSKKLRFHNAFWVVCAVKQRPVFAIQVRSFFLGCNLVLDQRAHATLKK